MFILQVLKQPGIARSAQQSMETRISQVTVDEDYTAACFSREAKRHIHGDSRFTVTGMGTAHAEDLNRPGRA
jgi:hypothetical protein